MVVAILGHQQQQQHRILILPATSCNTDNLLTFVQLLRNMLARTRTHLVNNDKQLRKQEQTSAVDSSTETKHSFDKAHSNCRWSVTFRNVSSYLRDICVHLVNS